MTKLMHKFLTNLSVYLFLTCFWLSFSLSSEAGVKLQQWFKSPRYNFSARVRMDGYPGDLDHCRSCTPAPEDELKESPKHVRQK
jgi:hypothetical protein